ncbi:c-type cytochrome [Shewanella sedimentimangrovi]|uniref:cytochrome-c oxidase n=1 Tax=Shewanella sedimentimangrovi TaxID=2814293 RepID=A0ABX7R616_9GAMM|nr:c-type cytochrome [Shewanella sedimentimangrovi]QSX38899.1 c-type cytochrome [Shewanella sedimentimangrovi]
MALVVALVILIIATLIFHFTSPWWFTPLASNWQTIDDTINITFWVTGLVFIAVNSFLAFALFRYRFNRNRRADYEPENKKLETWLVIATSLGIAAMLAPGLFVWNSFIKVPKEAHLVEAVGQQWSWSFRLPGADGQFGQSAVELITEQNPFGINPDDVNGLDDVLIEGNEMHLLQGQAIKLQLRSKDVLHSFSVPQFRVKMDLVPGLTSYMWFTPTKAGRFELLCQELCGMAHYTMRGIIQVDPPTEYQTWLASQPTFSQTQQQPQADIVAGKGLYQSCSACHGQAGEGNVALDAPALAGQGAWYLERQLQYFQQGIRGAHKDDIQGQQMAAMARMLANNEAIRQISAYIATLSPKSATASGDVRKGKALYHNCSFCHGEAGEGNYNQNAPRLAGQHDWYLRRQLEHFKQGIRGAHQQDLFGKQMIMMSRLLQSPQAIDDVVAYITALPGAVETIEEPRQTLTAQTAEQE